jgi:WD40 repeat protein
MASLFVSHSSSDLAATKRVVERLVGKGFAALFLDFDPADGIPAGHSWESELYAQLRKTDGVVFLASAASVASQWCFAEVSLARSLGKPVFPVRVEGGVRLGLLDDVQWIDLAEGEAGFARLWGGLRRAGLDPADSFAWDPTRSPYPGLESFTGEDAAVFFGRNQEIDRLVELLQPTLQRGGGRFVAIVGPSGSGKSSLLRAGLLPRLDARWAILPVLVPGKQPTQNLAHSVAAAFAIRGRPRPLAEVTASLERGAAGLVKLAVELGQAAGGATSVGGGVGNGRAKVLIVIDQAEELLTRSGAHEQQAFLRLLDDALGDDSPVWVVATVRSEFLSTAPERAGLAEVVDDPLVVEPLSRTRLPEVIQRPAQRAGLQFTPGLVERMVEDTTGGDALPLLAYTLRALYQRAGPDGKVNAADYEAVGGVVGALQRRADQLTDELGRRGQGQLVLPTLMKFAAVEGEGEPTRRRIPRGALGPDEQTVADAFIDARLLTSGTDPDGETTVEVAHEALLRQWPPLREAIEAARASLRMRSELERLAADWDLGGRDESYLLRGGRLAAFDRWATEHGGEVSLLERRFLEASRALASRELAVARRSNRRLRALVSGLVVVLVLTLAAGGLAVWQQQRARAATRTAVARGMVAQADRVRGSDPRSALRLGVAANKLDPSPLTRASLLQTLTSSPYRGTLGGRAAGLPGSTIDPLGVLSPDGKMVVTTSKDRKVILWDLSDRMHPRRLDPLTGHTTDVTSAAFAPDGRTLATVSEETVILWDLSDRNRPRPLTHHSTGRDDSVGLIAYAPDGKTLVTTSGTTATLWDLTDRARPRRLGPPVSTHQVGVTSVAFAPDGHTLVTGGGDDTVILWDLGDRGDLRRLGRPLTGHSDYVTSVAFAPDGHTVATGGGGDHNVILWDLTDRRHPRRRGDPLTHEAGVEMVAFAPDGRTLATGGWDETITLWDVTNRKGAFTIGEPLRGHTDTVTSVAFAPDGHTLASASFDESVILWDIGDRDYPRRLGEPLRGHTGYLTSVTVAPDGRTLASASEDRTVILWDLSDPGHPRRLGQPLTGHTSEVEAVAFAPDGQTLATAGGDQTVILWDLSDRGHPRRLGQPLTGDNDIAPFASVAFAPDGHTLAVASLNDVNLWDLTDRNHPRPVGPPLAGHLAYVAAVAFAPDGSLLATAGWDLSVILWDLSDPGHPRRLGQALTGYADEVTSLAFAPNGDLLAAGSYETIVLYDLTDPAHANRLGQPLKGRGEVASLAFTPDGHTLVTGGSSSFDLWDLTNRGQPRLLGQPHLWTNDDVEGVALTPSGHTLATVGSTDRAVTLWDLTPLEDLRSNMVGEACKRAGGPLDKASWDAYAPGISYQDTCGR